MLREGPPCGKGEAAVLGWKTLRNIDIDPKDDESEHKKKYWLTASRSSPNTVLQRAFFDAKRRLVDDALCHVVSSLAPGFGEACRVGQAAHGN